MKHHVKRSLNLTGPFIYSAGNFVSSVVVQQSADLHEFGVYALCQTLAAILLGISNALFGSPLVSLVGGNISEWEKQRYLYSFAVVGVAFCMIAPAIALGMLIGIVGFQLPIISYAVFVIAGSLRWNFRGQALADHRTPLVVSSDWTCGLLTASLTLSSVYAFGFDIELVFYAQALACTLALLPLRSGVAILWSVRQSPAEVCTVYRQKFAKLSRWALSGVVTTEATTNGHAYIVSLVLGPAYFAPLAAVILYFRPLAVLSNAMTQFERPRIVRALAMRDLAAIRSNRRFFLLLIYATWFANSMIVLYLVLFSELVVDQTSDQYPNACLAVALYSVVRFFGAARVSSSAVLQAAGEFRFLARVSSTTAPFVLAGVLVICLAAPDYAALTLVAAAVGEMVGAIWNRRIVNRVLAEREGGL